MLNRSFVAAAQAAAFLLATANTVAADGAKYKYIAFTNCWTNPAQGARSELDFFSSAPATFGNAKPGASTVLSSSSNYQWEKGSNGVAYGDDSSTKFEFTIEAGGQAEDEGAKVGVASAGSVKYTVFKDKGKTLYSDPPYGCQVFYHAVPDSASSASSAAPASKTARPSSTSGAPAAATTTTPGGSVAAASATPSASATAAPPPDPQSSSGLSQGASIGVGVGVGIGGAALLGAFLFFLLRYLSQRRATRARGLEPGIEQYEKQGIDESYRARPPGIQSGMA